MFLGHAELMKLGTCLCVVFLACELPAAEIVITTNRAQTNNVPRTNLPPATVVVQTNAFKGLRLKPGFRLELVASEPLVINPGAMAFDENGRLFVLEMPEGQPGRVRLLEDTDGDGIFDSSRVYADNVYGPTALACYDGGVFVGASGQIIYFKDTKGDGLADTRRVIFSSFGDATNGANGAVIITAILWGLDNRFHVATAGRGGDIISSSLPKQSMVLSAGCFSFDPRSFTLADEGGSGPSGMAFDNRGRKFVSSPANHIQQVMLESRYATRNPFFNLPDALADMDERNIIYPATSGQPLPAPITAAAGLTIYRGYLFPPDYAENPFVADTIAGVVHHDRIRASGLRLFAERAPDEAMSEFLSVTDNSFVPVAFAGGPEGALYISGPGRVPAVSSARGSATTTSSGSPGFGRIYRVVPANFKQSLPARFAHAAVTNLVNSLRHSDAWHRDSAARLLYERQDKAAILPLIQLLFDFRAPPLSRVYALHALDGLQTLVMGHVVRALSDTDERVREHGVLLSEKLLGANAMIPDLVWGPLQSMAGDPSPQVRYQVALTLGECRNPGRVQALAATVRSDPASRWMQAAALSSLSQGAGEMLGLLAGDGNYRNDASGRNFLARLANMIGAQNQPDEVGRALNAIAAIPERETAFRLALRLGDGLQTTNSSLAAADPQGILRPLYALSRQFAMDVNAAEPARVQAMRLADVSGTWDPQLSAILINQWPYLTPRLRTELVTALCNRPDRTAQLVFALRNLGIPIGNLWPFPIQFLLTQPDNNLRTQTSAIYGNPAITSRRNVVDQFAGAAQMTGVWDRGRTLFISRCGDCHVAHSEGNPGGLPLKIIFGTSREDLLANILDPNRDISTNSSSVIIITADGQTLAGGIAAQNAHSVTLCQPNGELRVLARQNVQSEINLGISAMPDGLEAGLNQQDMADLLEFLAPGTAEH
jgi:putative membrane-bound dehydrogenase-like protein